MLCWRRITQKVRQYTKRLEDMAKELTMHQKIQQHVERIIDVLNPWSNTLVELLKP